MEIVDIRGNVDTRIRKMEEGVCDALVVAATGLQRLRLDAYIRELLDPALMVPAVGQGAIAMQIRRDDDFVNKIVDRVNHRLTYVCTRAERIFLRQLEGGCQIPIGCFSSVHDRTFTLSGFLSDVQGNKAIVLSKSGPLNRAEDIAYKLAADYLNGGAGKIIRQIKEESNV